MAVKTKQIPSEVRNRDRWILWRFAQRAGKTVKQPCYRASDGQIRSTGYMEQENWSSWEDIQAELDKDEHLGVGYVWKKADEDSDRAPLVAIDIDGCRDPETGTLTEAAAAYVKEIDSYTEISPSGKGLRILVQGRIPKGRRKDTTNARVEFFCDSGYTTITGNHLEGTPSQVKENQAGLEFLYGSVFPERAVQTDRNVGSQLFNTLEMTVEFASELMESLDVTRAESYSDWLAVGMSLKSIAQDDADQDEELFELWNEWSSQSFNYSGHDHCRAKWDSFSGKGLSVYSLLWWARQDGWRPEDGSEGRPGAENIDPADAARRLRESVSVDGVPILRYYNGGWIRWSRGRWGDVSDHEVRPMVQKALNDWYFRPMQGFFTTVYQSLQAELMLSGDTADPSWLPGYQGIQHPPAEMMASPNSLVHLPTGATIDATPWFFNRSVVDTPYHPGSREPVAFLAWLREIFADHGEDLDKAIELLQMWYGYCLTSDTSQQKMLVLTGPSRSGKSTIEKVLRCLLGQDNVAGIRLSSFQEQFGLSTLIGRQLAVMGDVRVGKSDRGEITQKLLSVIGEDVLDIDRKYKTPISSKVNAKLMLIGNEVPSLYDESGALRARYALLETTRSFKGNEDVGIEKRFFAEAEGILLWAVEGWRKLRKGQKFPVLGLAETYLEILSDDTAPVSSYVGERLVVADRGDVDDTWASSEGLYVDYTWWCGEAGRQPFARATFFKKLRAELPFLRPSRRRVEIDGERKQAQGYAGVSVKPNGPSL